MRRVKAWVTLILIAVSAHSAWAGATFDEVKASWQPSDIRILDRHGEELHRLRTDASVRRGQWVALADVSPALRTAMVLSEDKRFFEHSGVDWQAVSAAAWANLWNTRTRGASTITMQLAGLLDDDLRRSASGRSVLQKVAQTVSAQWLERSWRKDQILEAYLNLVSFRGELVGIDALSQTLFGKAAHGLDAREAAVAAALVRAPNAKPAQVAQRACAVLASMALANAAKPAAVKPGSVTPASAASAGASAAKPGAAKPASVAPASAASAHASAAKPGAAKPGSVAPASAASGGASAANSDAVGRCDALAFFTTAALQRRDYAPSAGLAPHLARQVLAAQATRPDRRANSSAASTPTAGSSAATAIRTTLLAPLQRFAVQTLQQHLRELDGRHVEDGALLVLDNASGEVLAWVGSSGELSRAGEVDAVTALRQPGSTLKPFLYAQAIAEGRLTAASLLEDSSTQIQTSGGLYIPQNYDRQFKGWVSVRTALGASLNVPAVRTLVMVSPDAFHQQLVKLGLPLPESGGYYGYSLALGSAEVSLLNLTNAYRSLANGGLHGPISLSWPTDRSAPPAQAAAVTTPSARQKPAALRPVIDARAAFIVSDILSDPLARARTFGMDSVLATRFWTAVKTGTSKDMRDNWALGYSQRYTVGVWVGNASGAPMWDVSGTTGAAPIWAALMNYLHRQTPSHPPRPPPGVIRAAVQFAVSGTSANRPEMPEAARQEWFLHGTQQATFAINLEASSAYASRAGAQKDMNSSDQPAVSAATGSHAVARITAPTSGTVIALDPDIPPQRQRVSFSAQGNNLRWLMDGRQFAKGPTAQWLPWPGRHLVQLTDGRGQVQDEIRLEVRGAGIKLPQRRPQRTPERQ